MSSLLSLIFTIAIIAGMWKIFEKAGEPGWASLIPIYNAYTLIKVAGKPGWWVILLIIPIINLIVAIIVSINLAKRFGKPPVFGIGLLLLPFIFYPLLGFGDDQYIPPEGESE